MGYAQITNVAKQVPNRVVTNQDLAKFLDTSDDWIVSRTGIRERRIVEEETVSSLSSQVVRQLMKERDILSLDFIIVATMTGDFATPSVACLVQREVGADNALCFDINAACSGFIYALSTAEAFISSGKYARGVVIGADVMSSLLDWSDRSTAVLFGDGAAGVLLENTSVTPKFIGEKIQADGQRAFALYGNENVSQFPHQSLDNRNNVAVDGLKMTGKQIFDFALRDVSKNMTQLLGKFPEFNAHLTYVLAHQANSRILDAIAKKTGISQEKFLSNVANYGNTSAASVPLLLAEFVESGELVIGSEQHLILTGYGAGLTWGSILVKL